MVTKQFSVTVVICGSIMNAHSLQKLSMKLKNTNCTWICPKCEFFNFSDSFFGEQVNLETENRFVPITKEKKDRSSLCDTNKSSFISGLKFISMNINNIRGQKLELLVLPPVVYTTDRSKAVVPMLFLFCVAL